jgi:hypothetical protein
MEEKTWISRVFLYIKPNLLIWVRNMLFLRGQVSLGPPRCGREWFTDALGCSLSNRRHPPDRESHIRMRRIFDRRINPPEILRRNSTDALVIATALAWQRNLGWPVYQLQITIKEHPREGDPRKLGLVRVEGYSLEFWW